MERTIKTNEISPTVLKAIQFSQGLLYPNGFKLDPRYVYDYEFEFYTESQGAVVIDGIRYDVSKGDIMLRKPGQYVYGVMPYACYLIIVDMLGDTGKLSETYDFYVTQDFQGKYINPILNKLPIVFHCGSEESYKNIFEGILNEFISEGEASQIRSKALVLNLLQKLYEDTQNPILSNKVDSSPYYKIIKTSVEFIHKNINRKIQLEELAEKINMSPSHFHKLFVKTMDITPNEYIIKCKLEKAKEYLVKTDLSISDIALSLGYENIPYFSYLFKKEIGITPGDFRKKHKYF